MGDNCSHSFLPLPQRTQTQYNATQSFFTETVPNAVAWPDIAGQPINEFNAIGLASQAFPTLFPFGTGDPTCTARHHPVSLAEHSNISFAMQILLMDSFNGVLLLTPDFHIGHSI